MHDKQMELIEILPQENLDKYFKINFKLVPLSWKVLVSFFFVWHCHQQLLSKCFTYSYKLIIKSSKPIFFLVEIVVKLSSYFT